MVRRNALVFFYRFAAIAIIQSIITTFSVNCQSADSTKVTIVFAGDIMGHMPVVRAAYDSVNDSFDFGLSYKYIKPFIANADIAIGNLETSLAGKPYTGYPQFSSPDDMAGFDIFVTANNHCNDRGRKGLERTSRVLDSAGITHTGSFVNANDKDSLHPLIYTIKNKKIAFINYTYSTNGIPVEYPNIINKIDSLEIKDDIKKAKEKADIVIAIMHWGVEYERFPNYAQKSLAKYMFRNGCDAIIGSHPHVVQTYQVFYPDKADSSIIQPVIYSLGNFISNQRDRYKDGGVMFKLVLDIKEKPRVDSCSYMPYWVYKGVLKEKYQYYILPVQLYQRYKTCIPLSAEADSTCNEFYNDTRDLLKNLSEDNYYNKYTLECQ
jgi:poly-gamma-glutamate capsule biosynthesis protein CapA/YwtB (metallophosphatase superfamily)